MDEFKNQTPKERKRNLFLIIILFFLFLLWQFFKPHTSNQSKTTNDYILKITHYPQTIKTYCDHFDVQLQLTNNSSQPLTYDAFKNKTYRFSVCHQDECFPVSTEINIKHDPKDNTWVHFDSMVLDFGEIPPSSSKEITIRTGADHTFKTPLGDLVLTNLIANELKRLKSNGDYDFYFTLNSKTSSQTWKTLTKSQSFTIHSEIFDGKQLKACPLFKN